MSKKSLVLVVGAGASKEVNLPIGAELKHQIAKKLDIRFDDWGSRMESGDDLIERAFRSIIANEKQGSIDSFLQHGRTD